MRERDRERQTEREREEKRREKREPQPQPPPRTDHSVRQLEESKISDGIVMEGTRLRCAMSFLCLVS